MPSSALQCTFNGKAKGPGFPAWSTIARQSSLDDVPVFVLVSSSSSQTV